ncbi:MAG: hypothetical protein IJT56_00890 [Clostridia bacterium]|nr:hypothetical protein [Clostridia bacterium]
MKSGSFSAALAALLTLTLIISACSDGGGSDVTPALPSSDASQTSETETEAPDADPGDGLPEADLGGAVFTILTAAEEWVNDYYVSEMTGDIVDDAVFRRNSEIEERFGVKLDYLTKPGYSAGTAEISKLCTGSVMSGSGEYDLVITNSAYTGGRILEDVFTDLKTLPYQDFDKPWWVKFANDNLTVGGRLFAAAGRYSLSPVKRSWAVYFNKNVAQALSLPDFYADVKAGKWTYDAITGYGRQASADMNGDGKMGKEDRFGIIGTSTEPFWAWQTGLGRQLSYYDESGVPHLTGDDVRTCDIYDRLRSVWADSSLYYGAKDIDPYAEFVPMLGSDMALFGFYTLNITANQAMRDIEQYGILPLPKFDEAQENYYTHCFTDVQSVLKVTKNPPQDISLIIEALNAENNRSVIPQFYEVALLRKYARDDDSADMLEIICSGCRLDISFIFYSSIAADYFMPANLFQKYDTFTTFWAKSGEKAEAKLADIADKILSF